MLAYLEAQAEAHKSFTHVLQSKVIGLKAVPLVGSSLASPLNFDVGPPHPKGNYG
jgi:hypothetical protein